MPQQSNEYLERTPSGDTFTYTIDVDGSVHVKGCRASGPVVAIPEELGGCPVTVICSKAFSGMHNVEKIVCPSTLETIEAHGFESCLGLRSVELNDGLVEIGTQAFALCTSLAELRVPGSVERMGYCVTGTYTGQYAPSKARTILDPASEHLFYDEQRILCQRTADGIVLVDGSSFEGCMLDCPQGTVGIGPHAFSGCTNLVHVVLPQGCKRIGTSAFRGCSSLARIDIAESVERIDDAAFARTALASIHIPAACVNLGELALDTSSALPQMKPNAYRSTLASITVDEGNPRYRMSGSVLCQKSDAGLRAICCTGYVECLDLASDIDSVAPGALAGAADVKLMRVREGFVFDATSGLLPNGRCETLVIEQVREPGHLECPAIELEIPAGELGRNFVKAAFSHGAVECFRILELYDAAISAEEDELSRARHMLARLSHPVHLAPLLQARFTQVLEASLESVCVHFGLRAYWTGFEQLVGSGIVGSGNIAHLAAVLSSFGDAQASGYLLGLRNRLIGKACWDYGL